MIVVRSHRAPRTSGSGFGTKEGTDNVPALRMQGELADLIGDTYVRDLYVPYEQFKARTARCCAAYAVHMGATPAPPLPLPPLRSRPSALPPVRCYPARPPLGWPPAGPPIAGGAEPAARLRVDRARLPLLLAAHRVDRRPAHPGGPRDDPALARRGHHLDRGEADGLPRRQQRRRSVLGSAAPAAPQRPQRPCFAPAFALRFKQG